MNHPPKKFRIRHPHLRRSGRILRNFLLSGLLLVFFWGVLGYPLPTLEQTFRRLEREYLLTPSQMVYQVQPSGSCAAFLTQGEHWITVGKVVTVDYRGGPLTHRMSYLHQILPLGSLNVVALPLQREDGSMVIAVSGAPAEAAAGRLELTLEGEKRPDYESWEHSVPEREVFSSQTLRQGDWFFFVLSPHTDHPDSILCSLEAAWNHLEFPQAPGPWPWRLTLWNAQGEPVLEQSGTLPEDLHLS